MIPAVKSSFCIADWFMERARAGNAYLQPRQLQCLLFLAQGHFAVAYDGRKLMPSVFVVDHAGPMDPNVYRAYENGRPDLAKTECDQATAVFLDAIWRQYAGSDTEALQRIISELGASEAAIRDGNGSEVDIDAMCRMFARPDRAEPEQLAPKLTTTQDGRPVTVEKWVPGRKPAA